MNKTKHLKVNKKAIIDFGSLKIKLTILNKQTRQLLDQKSYLTLLGKNIHDSGSVSNTSIEKLKSALEEIKKYFNNIEVDDITCIATEALRLASNKDRIEEIITTYLPNTKLIILDQNVEGELFFKAVSRNFPNQDIITMDIGGGSIQLHFGRYIKKNVVNIYERYLYPTGTYKLQQMFSPSDDVISEGYKEAKKLIQETYRNLHIQNKFLIFGSTCMQDFIKQSKTNIYMNNIYESHDFYTKLEDLQLLLTKIRDFPPKDRMHFYPEGGHFSYGSDYLLLNLITVCKKVRAEFIYPTNLNSSYGLI